MVETSREKQLASAPIGRLVLSMALPTVIAQLVNVLYNIVDRIYIGHMPGCGSFALTGVGVCFPIITLISAFSAFAGSGGAPLAAIELGKGRREQAERLLGNAVTMLLFFSAVLTVVFLAFKKPLLYAFGASDATVGYALDYITIYLCGTIFVQLSVGLNTFITSQGRSKIAMMSILIGALMNIILDPVFIFGFGMGVKGAAFATIISQFCSAVWVVHFLTSKKASLRIRLKNLKPERSIMLRIASLGVSPFIQQATESMVTIVFNSGLQHYGGDLYVGSMTILQSVMQLFVVPIQGFTMGTQPIISYNYGARNDARVKKTFKITLATTFSLATLCTLLAAFIPGTFAALFANTDSSLELIALVERVMPIFMAGLFMFGIQMACQSSFMGMGQAKISVFLALLRKVILLIPLALILPNIFGVMGIYFAEPVSDITAALTTGTLFLVNFNKILKKER